MTAPHASSGVSQGSLDRRQAPSQLGPALALFGLVIAAGFFVAFIARYIAPVLSTRDTVFLLAAFVLAALGMLNDRLAIILAVLAVMFTALLRRIYPAVEPGTDLVAIAPFIIMTPLALFALRRRRVPVGVLVALAVFALSAATVPTSGIPAIINLAVPVLAGLYVRSDARLQSTFAVTWLLLSLPALAYGIMQFFATPTWDAAWLIDANFTSAGVPGMPGFRPFGPFPSPGTAAYLGVLTVLIAALAPRSWQVAAPLRVAAIAVALPFIALSGVRSAWLFGAAALVVGLLTGLHRRAAVPAIAALMGASVAVSQIPALASSFSVRAQTLNSLDTDGSFQARSELLSSASHYVSLFGAGLGTGSNADRTSGGLDNGYIVVLAEGGAIGVVALLVLIVAVSRGCSGIAVGFMSFWLACNLGGYNFGNFVTFVVIACLTLRTTPAVADNGPPPQARPHALVPSPR